ncbi:MAG: rRNA maturation RNase YbeY [Parcubacteria group bacterium GW2011_GWA2_38_13b]|nr:MAG: rRNA maturation RNase YbeY [Parcubacteria group bacterium GW2011_GWA2_38_13b]
MKLDLNIYNKTNFSINENKFIPVIKFLLEKSGIKTDVKVDLNIISARNIAKINKKYRKIDGSTDVISFSYASVRNFINLDRDIVYLGEIFIAPSVVKANAKKYKTVLGEELNYVLVHGLLHLFEYEHEGSRQKREEMELMEQTICLNLKNKRINFFKKREF